MNIHVTDLRSDLHDAVDRPKLKNKRVAYRVRWDRETERGGTITRIGVSTVCIGAFVYHHDDLISLREIGDEPADRNAL